MSPIAASSAAAVTKLTPGRVSSRRISVEASTCSASARSISAISPSRKSIWRRQAATVSCSSVGQLLRGEPAASADAEEIAHRRLALQVADQRRVHLVLRPCALPDQLRPRRDPPAQDPRLLVRQPDRRQEAAGEQLRQRARVDLVGLRARPRDPLDRLRIREHHPAHVRLDDPRDPERVAGRLQRDLIVAAEALREQLKRRRLGLHPPRQPHLASLRDRDLAEVAMHVQPDEPHRTPPPSLGRRRRRRGGRHDNYGSVLAAHPDSRRGGHLQTAGSQPIVSVDGLPNLRLPEAPGIRNAPTLRHQPDNADTPPRAVSSPYNEHRPHPCAPAAATTVHVAAGRRQTARRASRA